MWNLKLFGRDVIEVKRENPTTTIAEPAPWLVDLMGGAETHAGVRVNEEKSLQVAAVYGCVNVLADSLAILPKGVYERVSDRERRMDSAHVVNTLIRLEPSEFYSSFDFFHAMMVSTTLWGNGFAYIHRDTNYSPIALELIHPGEVTILMGVVEGKRVLGYKWKDTVIPGRDMIHVKGLGYDGIQGQGVINYYAKESIGLSIAVEQFGAKYFGKDTIMTKYLSHPGVLGDKAKKHLTESWTQGVAGLSNAYSFKILEEGMKLESIGIPPEQSQFLETRHIQVEEICRWFKVPPHMIQHLLRSTNNNIEHQGIEFSTHTMIPWVTRFEQEFTRKLLREDEKDSKYVKFNMNVLMRGDIQTRTRYYQVGRQWGWLSANDVREKEDENSIGEQGDRYLEPLNMKTPGDEGSQGTGQNETKDDDIVKTIKQLRLWNISED